MKEQVLIETIDIRRIKIENSNIIVEFPDHYFLVFTEHAFNFITSSVAEIKRKQNEQNTS